MRSTFAGVTLLGSVFLVGTFLGTAPSPARADRPAPEAIRANLTGAPSVAVTLRMSPIPAGRLRACGTAELTASEAEGVRTALGRWIEENAARPSGGTIQIAFHVITSRGEGNVSEGQIAEQVRELNQNFAGSGYRFELATVDRTESPSWFKMIPGTAKEKQAKRALAIDPAHRLNLYTCSPGQSLIGWASYPWSAPESDVIHGVVLDYTSLPGGAAPFHLGRTATHEVGHYLGLFHTFQGGCLGPGDEVDDTPLEASAALGRPIGRNTCVAPGDDPVHNYMDYSDDASYTEFTVGQQERIHAAVPVYRPSLFSEVVARAVAQPEITPGAGAEPEDGRVLSYRGAFPNPFRAETAIRFTLPASAEVSLRIYSVTGQLARTLVEAQLPPGDHSAMFRAEELPSGAYFAVLKVGRVQMSRTLLLVR